MTLGVARNPYATNVADRLIATAGRLGVPSRLIDLPSLGVSVQPGGELTVADEHGTVAASSLAPYLLFGFPAAVVALGVIARAGRAQNPVDGVLLADDKAAAAARLARAAGPAALAAALAELAVEGPGALVVQPEVTESAGRSVRAVITGGRVLAVTERAAARSEWRSNIAGGAQQHPVELTKEERGLVLSAAGALGLGHAGVDILRTKRGP